MDVIARGQRPSDIITREGLENAIAAIATSGGSTNGVLHLLALAREAGVDLDIDDFDRIAAATPTTCDLKPGGRFVAKDIYDAGGIAVVAKRLLEAGILHEGRADRDRQDDRRARARGAGDRRSAGGASRSTTRSSPTGGLAILRGNLAPEGCVVKLSGHERVHHAALRASSSREEDAMAAVTARSIKAGDVVVIRNEGPAGGPACARCSPSPRRSSARGWGRRSRCSRTAASPAPRAASWPATSRPRPSRAARSRRSTTATRSPSMCRTAGWTSTFRARDRAARRRLRPPRVRHGRRPRQVRETRVERVRGRRHALTRTATGAQLTPRAAVRSAVTR
jgi:hypothetical protein